MRHERNCALPLVPLLGIYPPSRRPSAVVSFSSHVTCYVSPEKKSPPYAGTGCTRIWRASAELPFGARHGLHMKRISPVKNEGARRLPRYPFTVLELIPKPPLFRRLSNRPTQTFSRTSTPRSSSRSCSCPSAPPPWYGTCRTFARLPGTRPLRRVQARWRPHTRHASRR